jgi:hypothetical protein
MALMGCQRPTSEESRVDRWTWKPDASSPAAEVSAQQGGVLFVSCLPDPINKAGKITFVGFWSGTPAANEELKLPALMLGYDGAAPQVQVGWGFSLAGAQIDAGSPHFDDLIAALKTHHTVEAVLMSSGIEERRRRFSLEGAGPAIDQALAACGAGKAG